MKKITFVLWSVTLLFAVLSFAGCSDDEVSSDNIANEKSLQSDYATLMALPSISIIDQDGEYNVSNNTRSAVVGFPAITTANAQYLSSLTQSQVENHIDSLIVEAGGLRVLDSIQAENQMAIYKKLGGKEGIDALIEFSLKYLDMTPGWDSLEQIIPLAVMNSPKGQTYIEQAAYLDRVARPICELMIATEYKEDPIVCKMQLGLDLALSGVDVAVNTIIDAMSGGVETPELVVELLNAGVNVWVAWHNYEACCGRWH